MTHYFLRTATIYALLFFVRHLIDTIVSMVMPTERGNKSHISDSI